VERTFSWLENYRRIALDYEYSSESAEAMVQVSFIQIMLNRFFK
jgi:putative transposase